VEIKVGKIVLLASLTKIQNVELLSDLNREAYNSFVKELHVYQQGAEGEGEVGRRRLSADSVDGANGSGGDSGFAALDFRVSESTFCAQRFFATPIARDIDGLSNMVVDQIKYPPILRAQVCLVFDELVPYREFMRRFGPILATVYGYVTAIEVSNIPAHVSDK
jgi:hypothetical protein